MIKSAVYLPLLSIPLAFSANLLLNPGVRMETSPLAETAPAKLAPGTWTTDNAHSSIGFTIGHMGLAQIQGRFNKTAGTITADPKNVEGASVTFTIETASIDTNVEQRDNHLRTADFFDAATYPEIKFVSTNIRRKGTGYVADGKLTIKDVTKSIQIPFKVYGPQTDPMSGKERVAMVSSPFTINRKDFNINYDQKLPDGTPSVSDEVTIRLSVEALSSD